MIHSLRRILGLVVIALVAGQAWADEPRQVLTVGPGKRFENPSAAAAEAVSGDTVRIFPGTYVDCAVWRQSDLVIEGAGDGAVIGNRACAGKGVFVIAGDNVTVRNVTLTGARVPDHNGSGIRAEGGSLTVERSRFIDNEDGILAAVPGADVVISDSYFRGNGNCIGLCAHGIYISSARSLRVQHSQFVQQHVGHHIKSRALVTELLDNVILDGPRGDSSYLIDIPNGGNITIARNRLQKGPLSRNQPTAIAIGAEQKKPQHPADQIRIENNDFTNDTGAPTVFVRNYTGTPALLTANRMHGAVVGLKGPGTATPP